MLEALDSISGGVWPDAAAIPAKVAVWRAAIISRFCRPHRTTLQVWGPALPAAFGAAATEDFMSDSQDHDAPHEGPIKTPKQLIVTVVASFVVPIAIIVLLVNYVASGDKDGAGSEGMSEQAVALRIQPVGEVVLKDASGAVTLRTGEQVYTAQCGACHAVGAAGSPKLGDEASWGPRITTGYEALLNSALKGKGAMAAQGGGEFSDFEIGRAVVFMANKAGGKLEEPKPPAAAASAASAADAGASAAK
jgi:cytochrome c5